MNIEVFQSFDDAKALQKEWDEFIARIDGEIFLTYDWCRIWWKYYGRGRDLKIFVMRQDGAIIAILPVFLEKLGIAPFGLRVVQVRRHGPYACHHHVSGRSKEHG